MSLVVSDTSPLRALYHLGLVSLLPEMFGGVYIPTAVEKELASASGVFPVIKAANLPGIMVLAPRGEELVRHLSVSLDAGEAEAIALAVELDAVLLVDERAGRAAAVRQGLPIIGALGVLLRAKRSGRLAALRPLLDELEKGANFYIAKELRQLVLRSAEEEV